MVSTPYVLSAGNRCEEDAPIRAGWLALLNCRSLLTWLLSFVVSSPVFSSDTETEWKGACAGADCRAVDHESGAW